MASPISIRALQSATVTVPDRSPSDLVDLAHQRLTRSGEPALTSFAREAFVELVEFSEREYGPYRGQTFEVVSYPLERSDANGLMAIHAAFTAHGCLPHAAPFIACIIQNPCICATPTSLPVSYRGTSCSMILSFTSGLVVDGEADAWRFYTLTGDEIVRRLARAGYIFLGFRLVQSPPSLLPPR